MKNTICLFASLLTLSCSSVPKSSRTEYVTADSSAVVTVRDLAPAPGTKIGVSSVLDAQIDYAIANFSASSEYYLVPLFDSADGVGKTFNEYERLTEGERLLSAGGSVRLKCSIAREWRSGKLTKPVRVRFVIMVRTGAHSTRVIGSSEKFEFPSAS